MEIRLFKQVSGDIIIEDLGYLLLTDENAPMSGSSQPGLILSGIDGQFTILEIMRSARLQQLINDGDIIITDKNGNPITDLTKLESYSKFEADRTFVTIEDYEEQTQEYQSLQNLLTTHTANTNIHFTKDSIYLNDLADVNVSNVSNGNFLMYSDGTWFGTTAVTDLSNYYTKQEVNANFLSANTFESTINTNGINNNGGITATTFYGNIDWSYIQNEPNFALYGDLTAHTSLTGSSNPHQVGFNDLTHTAHTHTKSHISDFVESDYVHTTGNENISGIKTFSDNVIINGNLYVAGTATTIYSENLSIKDNLIFINSGETGNGVSHGSAGLVVDRGDLTDYVFIFDENTDTFRIGEEGNTQAVATREDTPVNNAIPYWNSGVTRFDTSNKLMWDGTKLIVGGSISASTLIADIDWQSIKNTPTTLSGYGIIDAYTTAQTYSKQEVNANFLSANTFESTINTNGINNNGGITATTFYGNIDWSYIQNEPNFALYGDLTAHTSLTGASNPHQIGFNDLTHTAHTHDERYYTKSEADGKFYTISGGTIYGNVSINGSLTLLSGSSVYGISTSTGLTENSNNYLATQAAIKAYIASQTMITYDAARSGNVNAPIDLLRSGGVATSTTPFIVPKNMRIIAMSISTSANNTWTGSTLVNGVAVANVAASNQSSVYALFNINVSAGDQIRLRVTNNVGTVNNPAITVYLTER